MDPGAILIGMAILLLAGTYVLRPLVDRSGTALGQVDGRLLEMQAERERILDLLGEIDMDHAMGKLLGEEYQTQRDALAAKGAAVLRQIDELGRLEPSQEGDISGLGSELEAAVARFRSSQAGSEGSHPYCPHCGEAAVPGDRYCAHCGKSLGISESAK